MDSCWWHGGRVLGGGGGAAARCEVPSGGGGAARREAPSGGGWTIATESDWQLSNAAALTPNGRPFGQFKRGAYSGSPKTSSREAFVLAVRQFSGRAVVNCPFFFWFAGFCKFVGEFLRYIEANCPFRLVQDAICNFFGEFKHFARLYFPIASSRWKVMALVGQSPRD